MKISNSTIQKLHDVVDILEVVEEYVPLKKRGAYWFGLSPFTDEKTPSFSVTPQKGIFKCFSTGKGGDSISFIMEMEGMSYPEAVKHLAQRYNIEIETEGEPESEEAKTHKDRLHQALDFAGKYFRHQLQNHQEGRSFGLSYLHERGYEQHIIKKFELGYSLAEWDALKSFANKSGYEDALLEDAGLIKRNDNGKVYDRFRGRVMFPIHSISGKIIGFGARTLKKDEKPKYLNSPESEVYHKSDVLFGIYQAKNAIRLQDNCYLVEGYTDVISMHKAGIENVVASSGTSLTEGQIKVIRRFSRNVTILYDGDEAGINASLRGVDMFLEAGMDVKMVAFPEGEDPDSYVKQVGPQAFQKYLEEKRRDFILFRTEMALSNVGEDPLKKAQVISSIVQSIIKIPDSIKRAVFYESCSKLLGVDQDTLVNEGNRLLLQQKRKEERRARHRLDGGGFAAPFPTEAPPEQDDDTETTASIAESLHKVKAIHFREKEFIRLLLKYGHLQDEEGQPYAHTMLEEVQKIPFTEPACSEGLRLYKTWIKTPEGESMQYLLRHGDQPLKQLVADMGTREESLSENWFKRFSVVVPEKDQDLRKCVHSAVLGLKLHFIKEQLDEALKQLGNCQTDAEVDEWQLIYKNLKESELKVSSKMGLVVS